MLRKAVGVAVVISGLAVAPALAQAQAPAGSCAGYANAGYGPGLPRRQSPPAAVRRWARPAIPIQA